MSEAIRLLRASARARELLGRLRISDLFTPDAKTICTGVALEHGVELTTLQIHIAAQAKAAAAARRANEVRLVVAIVANLQNEGRVAGKTTILRAAMRNGLDKELADGHLDALIESGRLRIAAAAGPARRFVVSDPDDLADLIDEVCVAADDEEAVEGGDDD